LASNILSADSEQLQQISQMFADEADMVEQVTNHLYAKYGPLRGGDWEGEGAEKFFATMEDEVFPKLKKLKEYFERSSETAAQGARTIEDQFSYVMSKTVVR
jgi:WXG100 family type VII secretion target